MKILQTLASAAALVMSMVACSHEVESPTPITPEATIHEACFSLPIDLSRTTIDPDGRSTRWAEGDNIAVWAKRSTGEYALSGSTFMLRFFSTEWDKAYFVGNIPVMSEEEYTYYISSPKPTTTEGTMATYTVGAEQSGEYDGKYDIMIAEPTVNGSITTGKRLDLNTIMRHKMHALKITVPEGRNLFGQRFYELEITFPQDVVGDITLDVTDPEAEPSYSNTSNVITVKNGKGFDAGDDIWVFVLPGTVSGDVSYKVRGERRSSEVATYAFSRTMQAGHVTPIRMAIPVIFPMYTAVNFSISQNNLGEDFNYFDIYNTNGTHMGRFERNAANKYIVDYEGEFDANAYDNTTWRVVFDSEHAIVETIVNLGDLTSYTEHSRSMTIPYLMAQDFSSVSDYTDEATTGTKTLSISGWTASRTNCKSGVIQLATFYAWIVGRYQGRLDSEPISNLKKSAKIKVTFDANNNINKKVAVPLQFGWGTDPGAIGADAAISTLIKEENLAKGDNKTLTYTISDFAPNGRLAWRTNVTSGSWTTYNYLGIDNIKVQIAQ
ncbi:MAG: hypothetical protein IKV04_00730 [Alistipes sp.]|nr:hypothetical protein [Alistipes sp.]